MLTVPAYAELRALAPVEILSPVYVLGANTAGDGGGGLFFWDPNTPHPPYLDDNAGIVLTSNNSSTGRSRREGFRHFKNPLGQDVESCPGPINVKWFGAMGDGVTDDANAIQLAFKCGRIDKPESLRGQSRPLAPGGGFTPTLPYSFLMGTTT